MKASLLPLAVAITMTSLACQDSVSSDSEYSNIPDRECDPAAGAVCDCAGDDDCPPGFHCQITDASLRDICVPDDVDCRPDNAGGIVCCDPDTGACPPPPPPPGCDSNTDPDCGCNDPTVCPPRDCNAGDPDCVPPPDDDPRECPDGSTNCNDRNAG